MVYASRRLARKTKFGVNSYDKIITKLIVITVANIKQASLEVIIPFKIFPQRKK